MYRVTKAANWRFNNYWLSDTDFIEEMTICIQMAKEQETEDPNLKWEWMKYKICEFCIAFITKHTREQKAWIAKLEKRLSHLANQHDLSESPEVVSEVSSLKREIAEIQKHQANRAIFKSKAHWTQLGERPIAYFLGLKKHQYKEKTMTHIEDKGGQLLTKRFTKNRKLTNNPLRNYQYRRTTSRR